MRQQRCPSCWSGDLGSSAKVARETADRLTVRTGAIALAGGNKPHVAACTAWPDGDAGWLAIIAQPCFPPRLQQAGSLESPSEANTASCRERGEISVVAVSL